MQALLKRYFGFEAFRPMQEEIVRHVVSGEDSLVIMPTGSGKSLCYQLPALALPGMTIVLSPLIALMKDQVDSLRANGIAAATVNSSLPSSELARVEMQAMRGEIRLLYIAPERLAMPRTLELLRKLQISLLAVDEAHCISEWGHDFRPEYRNIGALRTLLRNVPVVALTATANARVRDDIVKQLGLEKGRIFQSSFDRPNLTYRVVPKKKAFDRMLMEIRRRPHQAVIIYCFSRKGTEKVAADLRANGIKAAAYHAGMTPAARTQVQDRFIRDEVPVIAATIAFGMGIDKPDVRLVVHMDLPKSVEGYYQETGRAGRDGLPSDCLLLYSAGDRFKQEYFIREMTDLAERARARRQLDEISRYGAERHCRRAFLLRYFGEMYAPSSCGACDVCVPQAEHASDAPDIEVSYDQELFQLLRATRRALAEAYHVPPYVIFGDRTLQEMARVYPQSTERLATITGVGRQKLSQFGPQMLEVIRAYARKKGIVEQPSPARIERKRPSRAISATVQETVRLFHEKQSIEAVAQARKLAYGTILNHLEDARQQGVEVDVSGLQCISTERLNRIAEAFRASGGFALTPVRARLGESYSFDELRLARLILSAKSL